MEPKDKLWCLKEDMESFAKFFEFLSHLVLIAFLTALAVLCTAFAGSSHGAPKSYLIYIAITQVIPIIIFCIASLIMSFQMLLDKDDKFSGKAVGISFAVYIVSILIMFNVPNFMKLMEALEP